MKLIFNIVAIVFVILSFVLLVFNSINVEIRWYGVSYTSNLYNGSGDKVKVLVDSLSKEASGYDIAFGGKGFSGSFLNQLIIILLAVLAFVLLLRFIFSFIERFNKINVIFGLVAGWGILLIGIFIWLFPVFAKFSNDILSVIKEKDEFGYEVIVSKSMTPMVFFSGLVAVFSGLCSLISIHLRFD
ncbi:MAG: hypothetical protein K6E20_02945 [Acholeplasmatales bacterium]|nr:hypothetical protein [Acholeplasmatales bacterium]